MIILQKKYYIYGRFINPIKKNQIFKRYKKKKKKKKNFFINNCNSSKTFYKSECDSNEFAKIVDLYNRLIDYVNQFHKKNVKEFRKKKKNIYIGLKLNVHSILIQYKYFIIIENRNTFFAFFFLDLKKAYDSIPIYIIILMKIHHFGIRGRGYKYIENLYLSSKAWLIVRVD